MLHVALIAKVFLNVSLELSAVSTQGLLNPKPEGLGGKTATHAWEGINHWKNGGRNIELATKSLSGTSSQHITHITRIFDVSRDVFNFFNSSPVRDLFSRQSDVDFPNKLVDIYKFIITNMEEGDERNTIIQIYTFQFGFLRFVRSYVNFCKVVCKFLTIIFARKKVR